MLFSNKKTVMISGKNSIISEIQDDVKRSNLQNISSCIYQTSDQTMISTKKDPVFFAMKEVKMQVCLPDPLITKDVSSLVPKARRVTTPLVESNPPQITLAESNLPQITFAEIQQLIHKSISNIPETVSRKEWLESKVQADIAFTKEDVITWIESKYLENKIQTDLNMIEFKNLENRIQTDLGFTKEDVLTWIDYKNQESHPDTGITFTKEDVIAWIEIESQKMKLIAIEERKKTDIQIESFIRDSLNYDRIAPIVEKYFAHMIEEDSRVVVEDDADLSEGARSKLEEMLEPAVGRIVQRIIKYDYEQDKINFPLADSAAMNLDINYDEVYDYDQQEKSHFEAPLLVPQPPGMYNPMYETAAELTIPPDNDQHTGLDVESVYKGRDDSKVFYVNELRTEYKSRKWIRFGNGIETGNVLDMVLDKTNKKIYIVGHFKHVNRIPIDNVAVYNVTDNVWSHVGNGISSVATCVAIYEESQILFVGGVFTKVGKGENQTPANNIAAYYVLENRWISLGDGLNRDCTALVFDTKTEKLYAGGTFTHTGSSAMHYVGIYDLKTNVWTGLVGGEINGPCRCLMLANENDLYIGGLFTHAGDSDIHASYVAKYNLNEYTWNDLAGGLQGYCNTLAYDATENVVYVGGTFNSVGNKESYKDAHHIAKFRIATQTWETMNGGVNNVVNSLSFDEKDKCLYIGGAFTHTFEDNILLNHIGKFVPESDLWTPLANHFKNCKIPTDDKGNDNVGLNGVCRVMNLDDTSLFVAGSFQIAGSITANSIVRYVVKRGGGD